MKRRRMWFGSIAVLTPILVLAAIGVYALVGPNISDGGLPFSGIPLVRPAFAQVPPSPIPFLENNGGLSAYAQLDPADVGKIDRDFLIGNVFTEVVQVGDNYVIGRMRVLAIATFEEVFLYVDDDGWMLAASPRGKDGAEMLAFYQERGQCRVERPGMNPSGFQATGTSFASGLTALECAIGVAASAFGATIPTNHQWYHWEFSEATHLAVGGITARRNETMRNLSFAIPAGSVWKDASISKMLCIATNQGTVAFDGSPVGDCNTPYTPLEPSFPTVGETHTIQLHLTGGTSNSRRVVVGVVLVYRFP